MNKNLLKIGISIFAIILGLLLLSRPVNNFIDPVRKLQSMLGFNNKFFQKLLSGLSNGVEEKDPQLTAEERLIVENRLQEAQKKLTEATTNEEKFSAWMQIGFGQYGLGKYKEAKKHFSKQLILSRTITLFMLPCIKLS